MGNRSVRWMGVLVALIGLVSCALAAEPDDERPKPRRTKRTAVDSEPRKPAAEVEGKRKTSEPEAKRDPGITRIEVRLEAKAEGESFTLASGGKVKLEADPLLLTRHFSGVARERRKNPNLPGTVDLELLYEPRGAARFVTAAKVFRDRRYCLMLDDIVQSCAAFPPAQKEAYERGQFLSGVAETEANRFGQQLASVIRKAQSAVKAAERDVSGASPRALLEGLYRRAVKAKQPDWLDGERRGAYFGADLLDLWDRVDLAQAGGNREAPLDADPIAATTSMTLKSAKVGQTKLSKEDRTRATVEVTLTYKEPTVPHPVLYRMVREKGRWRIEDIGYNDTLSRQLKAYLAKALPGAD